MIRAKKKTLLNAGQIFENIDKTEYVIRHYYINEVLTGTSAGSGNINLDDGIHVAGVYSGDYYTVQYVNSHSLNPGDLIIDSWPLNSYTNTLAGAGGYAFEEYEMELSAIGISSATCTGVLMHITEDPDGNPVDFWYPHSPSDVTKFGYTLHIKTDYADVKENKSENTFLCYPNPANTFINLLYIKDGFEEVSFRIYDMQGNLTYEKFNVFHEYGKQIITIDVSNYAKGVYAIEMILNDETYHNKFIKQ